MKFRLTILQTSLEIKTTGPQNRDWAGIRTAPVI